MTRQQRILLAGALAVVSAGLTLLIGWSLQPRAVTVFMAREDLQACTSLTRAQLREVRISESAARTVRAVTDERELLGRILFRPLRQDELLLQGDPGLGPAGVQVGRSPTSGRLQEGQRVTTVGAVNITARPCDFVELYYKARQGDFRKVLDRPVQVVSADGGLAVLTTDEEARRVLDAQGDGQVQAVLAPRPKAGNR